MERLKMESSEIEMDVLQSAIENGIIDYKEIVVTMEDMKKMKFWLSIHIQFGRTRTGNG